MRGGSSKGVFFLDSDLPQNLVAREAILLRVLGSYGTHSGQIDGLGGATLNTSQVAIVKISARPDCDIDYTFGAAPIESTGQPPRIDWTNNCSHLTAAVGAFAVAQALVPVTNGDTKVRIWQVNLGKRIDVYVPAVNGTKITPVFLASDKALDADARIRLEFLNPTDGEFLPTGRPKDWLSVPGLGKLEVTLAKLDRAIVFVRADALALNDLKMQLGHEAAVKTSNKKASDKKRTEQLKSICLHAAVAMGLAHDVKEASVNLACLPLLCWVGKPAAYKTLAGVDVAADAIDVLAHCYSVGASQVEFDRSGSMALSIAAAIPGTIANEIARTLPGIPTRIGAAVGILAVGADVHLEGKLWRADRVTISRSARCLMSGWVHVP